MIDRPSNSNESPGGTPHQNRLDFLRKLYTRIGKTATSALFKTQTALQRDIVLPSNASEFIHSLTSLRQHASAVVSRSTLNNVAEKSNEVLASATTAFPLTLFPDSITLDRTKLTVTRRSFFFSSDVMSIRIEDILSVSATVGPFFGSLTIATRVMSSDDHFMMRHLRREDVIHLKHMIQGYVIARHNNIACDHLSLTELIDLLQELGKDTNKERSLRRRTSAPDRLL